MLLDNIEIVVGTYEEFLLGYQVKNVDDEYKLVQTFASHDHQASIRCATSNGKKMASGGSDDTVHLYDMVHRRQIGVLMHHNGTVNCLAYSPNGSHLLSGGDDGVLAIHRVDNFVLEKKFGFAHKGSAILDISVHPSGKLALTVGTDATLRTWDLVKGRQAYVTRLGSAKCGAGWQITGVRWSANGTFYALGFGSKVDVYSVEKANVVYTVTTESKVCSFFFLSDRLLSIGTESGMLYIHDVKKTNILIEKKAHDQRVKCAGSVSSEDNTYIVSASSLGEIKLWEYKGKTLHELSKVSTGCRITCLTIPTCGYPVNFKVEKTEEFDEINTEECHMPEKTRVSLPIRNQVVIVEEDIEEEKPQRKKRKKKKIKQSESSLLEEETGAKYNKPIKKHLTQQIEVDGAEYDKPVKKHKTQQSELTNFFKSKNTKVKKRRSVVSTWEVSEIAS